MKKYNAIIVNYNIEINVNCNQNIILIYFLSKFLLLNFVDYDINSKLIEKRTKITYEHEFFSIQTFVI